MQDYTIQIRTNDTSHNEPPYSVYCPEFGITADDYSLSKAMIGLFSSIEIIESAQKKTPYTPKPAQLFEFTLPVMA